MNQASEVVGVMCTKRCVMNRVLEVVAMEPVGRRCFADKKRRWYAHEQVRNKMGVVISACVGEPGNNVLGTENGGNVGLEWPVDRIRRFGVWDEWA